MRYEKWETPEGDISTQLEGESEEIIRVLKYLDDVENKNERVATREDITSCIQSIKKGD